jgi:hypothetical protein
VFDLLLSEIGLSEILNTLLPNTFRFEPLNLTFALFSDISYLGINPSNLLRSAVAILLDSYCKGTAETVKDQRTKLERKKTLQYEFSSVMLFCTSLGNHVDQIWIGTADFSTER